MHIAFDIDGTICENSNEMVHDDPASILSHTRPKHAALSRLVKHIASGGTVSFVTARSGKVASATMKQLKTWLPSVAGVEVLHRDFEPYEMMQAVVYKVDALRFLKPDLFVGDLPMDQTAAAATGTAFMPAEWWAKGIPVEHLTTPDLLPGEVAMRAFRDAVPWQVVVQDAPGGRYACASCGNVVILPVGVMPGVCDACERPGPWAKVAQYIDAETLAVSA